MWRGIVVGTTFVIVLVGWEIFATTIYGGVIPLPTAGSTVEAFRELTEDGDLQAAALESLQVLLAGTIPGVILGIAFGLLIGAVRPLDTSLSPYLFAFYATPFPALIPIFILLFGLGIVGKGMIVFTLVVTTVLLQTVAGVKTVDARFIEAARSLGTSRARMLIDVQLPASLAFIIAGIRLAIGRALVGVVVAEFDTALSGLGALIFGYAGRLQLSNALVPALLFALTGIVLAIALRAAERRFERWRAVGA
ncbi:MAG TPA: ABC transporter permease subunit [Actinomycetota bacterium]|nr:ABC transporter permease subunit [Actinomycetota bacterium]